MHLQFILISDRQKLVEALLDLDHSHPFICPDEDAPEVLGVVAAVLSDRKYRILQLFAVQRFSDKEEVAENFRLSLFDWCTE